MTRALPAPGVTAVIDQTNDPIGAIRTITIELLSTIDAWTEREPDPGHFRHRLLRAHALAVLDELEQLASGRAEGRPPSRARTEQGFDPPEAAR